MASRAKCPVCLDDLQPPLAATLCGHVYCLSCLSASLASKNECPSCRANQLKLAKANKGKPVKLFLELPRISFEAGSVQAHLQEALDEEIAKTKKLEEELESRRARVNELERENRVHLTEINLLENTGKSQKKELANLKERYAEESRKRKRLEETRAAFEEELRRDLEIERSEFASQKEAHEQWHTHALKEKELGDRRLFKLEGQVGKSSQRSNDRCNLTFVHFLFSSRK